MTSPTRPDSKLESEIDWNKARLFIQRVVRQRLGPDDPARVEDLTQEALVHLLRVVRREGAQNLEGLMTVIARRTVIDAIRSRVRWREVLCPLDDSADLPADPAGISPEVFGDPDQRTRFVVLEFFQSRSPGCHALALAFFAEEDWQTVATRIGKGYAAVRQQWSRCLETLRLAARAGDGILLEWA